MTWTQERVNLLVKLWSDGYSASQIASELGNISRNAVIGKVHRLGISDRDTETKVKGDSHKKNTSSYNVGEQNTKKKKATLQENQIVSDLIKKATAATKKARKDAEKPVKSVSRRIDTVLELNDSCCRWPIGDPGTKNFYFCGAETVANSPYCAYHMSIAYNDIKANKKRKAAIVSEKISECEEA